MVSIQNILSVFIRQYCNASTVVQCSLTQGTRRTIEDSSHPRHCCLSCWVAAGYRSSPDQSEIASLSRRQAADRSVVLVSGLKAHLSHFRPAAPWTSLYFASIHFFQSYFIFLICLNPTVRLQGETKHIMHPVCIWSEPQWCCGVLILQLDWHGCEHCPPLFWHEHKL